MVLLTSSSFSSSFPCTIAAEPVSLIPTLTGGNISSASGLVPSCHSEKMRKALIDVRSNLISAMLKASTKRFE